MRSANASLVPTPQWTRRQWQCTCTPSRSATLPGQHGSEKPKDERGVETTADGQCCARGRMHVPSEWNMVVKASPWMTSGATPPKPAKLRESSRPVYCARALPPGPSNLGNGQRRTLTKGPGAPAPVFYNLHTHTRTKNIDCRSSALPQPR